MSIISVCLWLASGYSADTRLVLPLVHAAAAGPGGSPDGVAVYLEASSMWLLRPRHPWRMRLQALVANKWFEVGRGRRAARAGVGAFYHCRLSRGAQASALAPAFMRCAGVPSGCGSWPSPGGPRCCWPCLRCT